MNSLSHSPKTRLEDRLVARLILLLLPALAMPITHAGSLLTGVPDARLESNQPDPPGIVPAMFGASVAAAGDVNGDGFGDVIVGAPGWDGGDIHEGAAFVFLGSAAGIVGTDPSNAHFRVEGNQFIARLGTSVSGAGDVNGDGFDDIIVGAPNYKSTLPGTQLEVNGAAFVFLGSATGINPNVHATILANQLRSDLGFTVSGAGDVNGDGFGDIVIGVPSQGHAFPASSGIPPNQRSGNAGAVLIFHGSPAGIVGTGFADADAVLLPYEPSDLEDPVELAQFGWTAPAGDVNRDGYADILVGGSDVFLFLGSLTGIVGRDPTAAQSRIPSDQPELGWEFVVDGAGDVNGDGYDDVIIGAPFRELVQHTRDQKGAAYVFLGGPGGIVGNSLAEAHASFFGNLLAEWVGGRVAGTGDTDRDGYDDVLAVARVYPGSLESEGVTYLFRGSPQGIRASSLLEADARLEARQLGAILLANDAALDAAGAGDIDGDGFADVIIGKGFYDAGEENEGAAFLFLGGPWPANPNKPPVAVAGADKVVYDLEADGFEVVTVDGSGSFDPDGTITSYAWFKGETLLGSSAVVSAALPVAGDQTLVLVVTDDDGVSRGDPVTVRVDKVPSALALSDQFSSGLAAWTQGGDVVLSSADSFPTPPQVRFGASGAFLRRTIALAAGSTGVAIDFWAKATQLAPGDEMLVKVSVNGGPFTVIKRFTAQDNGTSYVFYGGSALPLGYSWHPATASAVVLEFESRMTTGRFFLDALRVDSLIAPPGATGGGGTPPTATLASVAVNPSSIPGGSSATGTVTLSAPAPAGGMTVSLSENSSAASVPPSVTVAGGATSATFNITTTSVTATTSVTITATAGTSSQTATLTLTTNLPPVGNAGPDQTLVDTDGDGLVVVTFDGTASSDPDGTIVSYGWRKNGNFFGNSPTFSVSQPIGTHTVELTVTDDKGATGTDTVVITINHPPPPPDNLPPVADAGPDQTVIDTDNNGIASVLLDGTGSFDPDGSISGYGWYEGGVQIASAFGSGVPLTVGVHTITLVVSDDHGATDTDTVTITVNAPAAPPLPTVLAVALSPSTVTAGGSAQGTVSLNNPAPSGGATVTLSSSLPSAASVPASVVVPAGTSSATFTVTTGSVSAQATATITAAYNNTSRSANLTITPTAPAGSAKLTVTVTGRKAERVTSSPSGISVQSGNTGSASFPVGTRITLTVSNRREATWSGDFSSNGRRQRSLTFTLNGNASVTANIR